MRADTLGQQRGLLPADEQLTPSPPQYAILMTMVLTVFIKYVLHSVDLQSENPWDNKAVYMLYTELFTGIAAPGPRVPCSPPRDGCPPLQASSRSCCTWPS